MLSRVVRYRRPSLKTLSTAAIGREAVKPYRWRSRGEAIGDGGGYGER